MKLHPTMGQIRTFDLGVVPEEDNFEIQEKYDSKSYQAASSHNHNSRHQELDLKSLRKSDDYDMIGRLEINLQRFESEES